jgi:hypothetical protein
MEPRDAARAVRSTVADISRRDVSPSLAVARSAAAILARGALSLSSPALEYQTPSSDDPSVTYSSFLVFDGHGYIERFTCTCEAGRAGRMCKHLLAALADAHHLGYRLAAKT